MLSAPDDFPFISFCFAWNTNVEPPPDVKLFVKIDAVHWKNYVSLL